MNGELKEKYDRLTKLLKELGSVAVAFSGGVDSTLLLWAAREALGDGAFAITATPQYVPEREREEAVDFCSQHGIRQIVADVDGLSVPGLKENPPDRCYICKKALFVKMLEIAAENGASCVAEGSNTDDQGDYRPGLKALGELGIKSPLKEAGLSKQDVRDISRELGLPTWDKPSFACLASRFVYGEEITPEKLGMVEKAEDYLLSRGFRQFRVRIHGEDLARIEVLPEDMNRALELRAELVGKLESLGFRYVSLDMRGYESGSMNRVLETEGKSDY